MPQDEIGGMAPALSAGPTSATIKQQNKNIFAGKGEGLLPASVCPHALALTVPYSKNCHKLFRAPPDLTV